jgi:hypothetical protein
MIIMDPGLGRDAAQARDHDAAGSGSRSGSGSGSGSAIVPPGFRFHPTDEELLTCYLRRKVQSDGGGQRFELDHVICDLDLNKLEPWDLRGNYIPAEGI